MTNQRTILAGVAVSVSLLVGLSGLAAAKEGQVKPYPLETCIVSGEKLGGMGEAFVFVHEGREIKLCCKSCKKDFDKDPAKFVAKFDEAFKKVKPYPLEVCAVSGEELGEMGDPFAFVYKNQEIKLCCKSCKKDFDKDPAKFLKKVQAAKKPSV